jgi:hypothetical protein
MSKLSEAAAQQFTGYNVNDQDQLKDPTYVYTTTSGGSLGGSNNGANGISSGSISISPGSVGCGCGVIGCGGCSNGGNINIGGGCGCGVIGCGGCSSGGITFTPYINPNPNIFTNPSSSTITFSNLQQKYTVFELPKEKKGIVPNKVYVSGRLVTVGILGSDVQAAFSGDKLVFSPGEIDIMQYNDKMTISLDYGDWLYHYNLNKSVYGGLEFDDDSNIVKSKLVSKVAQR